MHHRQILDNALRTLSPAKASYLSLVADILARHARMEEVGHLLYPVLAAAAAGMEPMLPPEECADQTLHFLSLHGEGIAYTLYSPAYLMQPDIAMKPWADRLRAQLAAAIFDLLAQGALVHAEPKVWRFSADGRSDTEFPYGDETNDGDA